MRYESLDQAINAAERFTQAARRLQKEVRAERREFPEHQHIDITHSRKTAEVRNQSSVLSECLAKLRRKT